MAEGVYCKTARRERQREWSLLFPATQSRQSDGHLGRYTPLRMRLPTKVACVNSFGILCRVPETTWDRGLRLVRTRKRQWQMDLRRRWKEER